MPKLTPVQVQQKLQEGRNYKRLYYELKDKYDKVTGELKAENKRDERGTKSTHQLRMDLIGKTDGAFVVAGREHVKRRQAQLK